MTTNDTPDLPAIPGSKPFVHTRRPEVAPTSGMKKESGT
jgi:hypothetical protein